MIALFSFSLLENKYLSHLKNYKEMYQIYSLFKKNKEKMECRKIFNSFQTF